MPKMKGHSGAKKRFRIPLEADVDKPSGKKPYSY